tara:strand:+ start:34720 stop:37263 length:2544 start_codon:yes stop_codon:yes gene_type:complete
MKKIIITGALGYIGMELCKIYSGKSLNYDVLAIDNKFYSARINQLRSWNIRFKQLDILDLNDINQDLKNADIVFHLAGVTDVPTVKSNESKLISEKIKNTAINGTNNVINSLGDKTKLVFPSTHVIFEGLNEHEEIITEENEPRPILAYSSSKFQNEIDIKESSKNYVILRLGSLYGLSGDSTRLNIMPNLFAKNTSMNNDLKIFGSGKQLKSLVSVFDVARCLEFVGENDSIKNETFNCVNENTTVENVAKICKKINNKINVIPTDDEIPNLGYWLDNTKIINTGFKFLYNLDSCLKEMIKAWSFEGKKQFNEEIVIGMDNYEDNRGLIENYYFNDPINMIGAVTSKKGSVRGNHYHPIQTQRCLLISGSYISVTKDLNEENSVVETRYIKSGELSIIPPNIAHTMIFLEDSVLLNLVAGEREHQNYGITHTIPYELVDKKLSKNLLDSYKTSCRVCGGGFTHYLSLGLSPLANNLNDKKNSPNELYPLDLNFCKQCSNSQLSVAVPAKKMFDNYLYLSSTSQQFKDHFYNIAIDLKKDLNLNKNSLLVDIGSNDGIFLDPVKKLGIKAVGVEPAKNVSKIANSKKLTTLQEYFSEKTVQKIINKYGRADVITAFNVFAHSDGLKEILNNVESLLKNDGEFIFEVQYIFRTIKDLTFDNIYHEHFNYWCLLAILNFFEKSSMKVYKVKEVDTHGGSLRIYATKNKKKRLHKSVNEFVELEKNNKLDKIETYDKFAKDVKRVKLDSLKNIKEILSENKKIVGYGAPAKATTILNYFGLNEDYFKYVIDDSEIKHGKYIPETNIQIISKDDINTEDYEFVLVLAWNFYNSIVKNNKSYFKHSKFIKLK